MASRLLGLLSEKEIKMKIEHKVREREIKQLHGIAKHFTQRGDLTQLFERSADENSLQTRLLRHTLPWLASVPMLGLMMIKSLK